MISETRRGDVVEELHGRVVADPYRWLEDEPVEWVRQQNAHSAEYLEALPEQAWFARAMDEVLARPRTGVPVSAGGWYLVLRNDGSQAQDVLWAARSLAELISGGQVVLDPNELAPDGSLAVENFSVSPDGRYLACGTLSDGNPQLTHRLIDLESGAEVEQVTGGRFFAATWLPDCSSFVYLAAEADAISGRLTLHRIGGAADQVIHEALMETKLSQDGQHLIAQFAEGTDQRRRVWVYPVMTQENRSELGEPLRLIDEAVANTRFVRSTENGLVLWTDLDAPNGRVVTCSFDDPSFKDLIAEADHPLIGVFAAGDGVLTVSLVDAQPVIDFQGARIPVTGGALVGVSSTAGDNDVFIGMSSPTTPTEISVLDTATGNLRRVLSQHAGVDVTVLRRKTTDREVPYFLISRTDLEHSKPRPTMLYGYGGFSTSQLADYRPGRAAWLAAGGVLVIANLRGGGEFGAAWHDAGRLERKQNTYDDCIAVAEHLHQTGVTTPGQLALHGHSGGGMLVGAVITQRPELFAVAVPSAGVMDMLRFHLFTIGRAWIPEIGSPEVPDDFDYLLAYSPLHNVHDGTAYPATLVLTSDHDEIVVPLHSYKFAAALQHAQAADEPVLLRVQSKVGHGPGRSTAATAAEWADLLAFAAHHTGLDPRKG